MNRSEAEEYRRQIEHAAQSQTDADALKSIDLYPIWEAGLEITKVDGVWYIDGIEIGADLRMAHDGRLYRVRQPHTTQTGWEPSIATASLFSMVAPPTDGTEENPIDYSGNMELYENLYYKQNGVIYQCFRNSEISLHNSLAELVGIYVRAI